MSNFGFLDIVVIRIFFTFVVLFGWETALNFIQIAFYKELSVEIDLDFPTLNCMAALSIILYNHYDKIVIENAINMDIKSEKNGI